MTTSPPTSSSSQRRLVDRIATGAPARGGPTDPSHDANLRRGILETDVSRRVAWLLVALFVAGLFAVPVAQVIADKRNGEDSMLPELFGHWPTKDSIRQFEEDLEKASTPREWVRPRLQLLLTRLGGFGNAKVVVGREGWLFYKPGVAAVGGPGLLDEDIMESRAKAARDAGEPPLFPDPRPAILQFRAYLAGRGITLVLVPIPDKAALQPRELRGARTADADGRPGANPDQARLWRELTAAGVLVFDPTPARLTASSPPRFLRQDTHWTPAWMEEVANHLADFLRRNSLAGARPGGPEAWTTTPRTASRVGDLVDMLGLPPGQTLFTPQQVPIHEIASRGGVPFEPDPAGETLLLGDSFSNVFTLGQMGWGEAAGFAPQLARALGRGIDVIAQNDAGAHATRQLLRNELAGPDDPGEEGRPGQEPRDRLSGKKVVVWEFAARELAVGNWKPIAWPHPPGLAPPTAPAAEGPGHENQPARPRR